MNQHRKILTLAAALLVACGPVAAQPVPSSGGSATANNQITLNGYIGSPATLSCSTDTGSGCAVSALLKRNNERLTVIDGHVDGIETLLAAIDGHVDGIEGLIGTTNTNTGATTSALGTTNNLLTTQNGYLDGVEGYIDGLEALIGTTNTTLTTQNGYLDGLEGLTGALTETAPASDTASSGLNGRLQRVAQRLTSLETLITAGNLKLTDIQTAANDTAPAAVVGNVAAAASDSGNPVKIGGVYNTSLPTYANGQRGDAQLTAKGAQIVSVVDAAGAAASFATSVAQGSATSGQTGSLVQGAVTTAAPTYTTAQTSPLSLTTAGALRVDNALGATAAKQPALGTAGASSADVITVQGRASMTPLDVNVLANTPAGATTTSSGLTRYTLEPGASDNHVVIKNGAGQLYGVDAFTIHTAAQFLRFYDAGTGFNGCNSATNLIWSGIIPAAATGAGLVRGFQMPIPFTNGLSICVTGAYGNTTTTSATASVTEVNVGYK